MKLGICTRYCHHEATYAATRIASWASSYGHEVSLLTMTDCPRAICTRWDSKLKLAQEVRFTDWVGECNAVLWTTTPHLEQIRWVSRQNMPTAVFVLWHELVPSQRTSLAAADIVLVPHAAGKEMLNGWGLRNVMEIAWDPGLPMFKKPPNYYPDAPAILLPLYDGIANRMELTAIELAGRALLRRRDASLTVMYNSSTLCSPGKKRIKELARQFPQRVQLLKGVHPDDRPLVFQRHDITLWPTQWESTCHAGLISTTMGTPIVAFGGRPIREMFHDGVHGLIVNPAAEHYNDYGLPRVVPDYELMDDLLGQLLKDGDFLHGLQQSVLQGFDNRRRLFEDQISRAFP